VEKKTKINKVELASLTFLFLEIIHQLTYVTACFYTWNLKECFIVLLVMEGAWMVIGSISGIFYPVRKTVQSIMGTSFVVMISLCLIVIFTANSSQALLVLLFVSFFLFAITCSPCILVAIDVFSRKLCPHKKVAVNLDMDVGHDSGSDEYSAEFE